MAQCGPDMITALGVMGTGVTLAMLVGQDIFTLGQAESCDLRATCGTSRACMLAHYRSVHQATKDSELT
jgi:hypothetical protein